VKALEGKIEALRRQALESAIKEDQDTALREAIRLAEEVLTLRERHQGAGETGAVEALRRGKDGEWYEVADARWGLRTLRALEAMDAEGRALLGQAERDGAKAQEAKEEARYAEAEALFREALSIYRRLFPGDHPDVGRVLNELAFVLHDRGDLQEADPLCREALEMSRRLFPGDHPDVARGLNDLATLLKARGDQLRQAVSDAGAAVLVELRGLFPEAQPLSADAVLDALPEGDLILSYLWTGNGVVLVTAGGGVADGAVLADTPERVKALVGLARSVRASLADLADRSALSEERYDPGPARELLGWILPAEARERAARARRLVVLPDGPLNDLPFDVLLAAAEESSLREKPVVVAASATVYLQRLEAARLAARAGSRQPAALILADPVARLEPQDKQGPPA
jgi:hypothetical protein